MIRSMTAFSEKMFHSKTLLAKISVKSLNHRFFDWNYKGAPLGEVENRLRAICRKKINRGRVEVFLDLSFLNPASWEVVLNEPLLRKMHSSLQRAGRRMNIPFSFSSEILFRVPQLMELRRKGLTRREVLFLEKGFEKTLAEVLKERKREGEETGRQIRSHAGNIRRSIRRIERLAAGQQSFIREKLKQRFKEANPEMVPSRERHEEETSFLALRQDISEEILRLKSHLSSLETLLRPDNREPIGKMLDFIGQELTRETNTINSKSQNIDIIKESLTIKGEVESIRQHIQNIE